MIHLTLINNKTGESVRTSYSVKDLISQGGEDLLIENIIENNVCHCNPLGETNVVECGCWEQWEDCTLDIEEPPLEAENQHIKKEFRKLEMMYWELSREYEKMKK